MGCGSSVYEKEAEPVAADAAAKDAKSTPATKNGEATAPATQDATPAAAPAAAPDAAQAPAATKPEEPEKKDEVKTEAKAEDEADEEEDDDEDDEPPPGFFDRDMSTKMRTSVSAEAYGDFNKKTEFTPPVHAKDDEVKGKLKKKLQDSFLFAGLEDKDFEKVILAVEEVKFEADAVIIQEKDAGDCLYIIDQGSPVVKKKVDGEDKVMKECQSGDVFGELALLYNCPRAASVVATGPTVCWKLDRGTFNAIVKDAAAKQRDRYMAFLGGVELLAELSDFHRSQVADAMKVETFPAGTKVITQGEEGRKLFIVEEGTLVAKSEKDGETKEVMSYKEGDYFGELALLKGQPRAVSVVATSDVKVLSLQRVSFEAMLGGLKDFLAKNASKYADLL